MQYRCRISLSCGWPSLPELLVTLQSHLLQSIPPVHGTMSARIWLSQWPCCWPTKEQMRPTGQLSRCYTCIKVHTLSLYHYTYTKMFHFQTNPTATDVCQLPAKAGNCRARIKRYYYNADVGTCQSFIYSGCNGNENNFKSVNECRKQCHKGIMLV